MNRLFTKNIGILGPSNYQRYLITQTLNSLSSSSSYSSSFCQHYQLVTHREIFETLIKISTMFPFHQNDELFQIPSTTHQENNIQQDLIIDCDPLDHGSLDHINNTITIDVNPSDDHLKIMRRDIERKRRQEMGNLCTALRSQLPIEYIKGKRSITDQMNGAVNYIKHLQKNIKELSFKRDYLEKKSNSSEGSSRHSIANSVMIEPCLGGVRIMFSSGFDLEQGLKLSKVVELLVEEGLLVVSCNSTKVNDRILHTIESEVEDPTCFNLSELQQKLQNLP